MYWVPLSKVKRNVTLLVLSVGVLVSLAGVLFRTSLANATPRSLHNWRVYVSYSCCPSANSKVCFDSAQSGNLMTEASLGSYRKTNLYSFLTDRKECSGSSYSEYYADDMLLVGLVLVVLATGYFLYPSAHKTWFYRKK